MGMTISFYACTTDSIEDEFTNVQKINLDVLEGVLMVWLCMKNRDYNVIVLCYIDRT